MAAYCKEPGCIPCFHTSNVASCYCYTQNIWELIQIYCSLVIKLSAYHPFLSTFLWTVQATIFITQSIVYYKMKDIVHNHDKCMKQIRFYFGANDPVIKRFYWTITHSHIVTNSVNTQYPVFHWQCPPRAGIACSVFMKDMGTALNFLINSLYF